MLAARLAEAIDEQLRCENHKAAAARGVTLGGTIAPASTTFGTELLVAGRARVPANQLVLAAAEDSPSWAPIELALLEDASTIAAPEIDV